MAESSELGTPSELAAEIGAEIRALPLRNTPNVRAVRRAYSKRLREAGAPYVLDVARALLAGREHRWVAYELVRSHPAAFSSIEEMELVELGQGIDSWWTVDAFARTLAGPAWLRGQVPDHLIQAWAGSDDCWWRRAALVSTVALNVRSRGGLGDTPRTLAICELLAGDPDDMVVKALSWALRELVIHDPEAVRAFLEDHEDVLAARVKREVTNKLDTGLKNPRGGGSEAS
jgi:3-methyladenine DNA glycosylase AlkD